MVGSNTIENGENIHFFLVVKGVPGIEIHEPWNEHDGDVDVLASSGQSMFTPQQGVPSTSGSMESPSRCMVDPPDQSEVIDQ